MSLEELRDRLFEANYPATFEVDDATYEAVEDYLLACLKADGKPPFLWGGPGGGVMFKGVELLCESWRPRPTG